MINTIAPNTLADQLLMCFPSGSYCLPALLGVLEIVETTAVPSACVECTGRPRLMINPEFVAEKAETPEKLMMLVLHELHHVILGHTRLYPRVTPLDNLVFDAVINAMLCRLFPQYAYTSLMSGCYREDEFPECFLRPPDDWISPEIRAGTPEVLEVPSALRDLGSTTLIAHYIALYYREGVGYDELRDALRTAPQGDAIPKVELLGDHRGEEEGASSAGDIENRAPALLTELRRITERWPRPKTPIIGRSMHDLLEKGTVVVRPVSRRTQLTRLLRRIGGVGTRHTRTRLAPRDVTIASAVPRSDRRALVTRALGGTPFFYRHELVQQRRMPAGERVHVYLDVSGSMGDLVGPLYGAILACEAFVHPQVHLFSTKVVDISPGELRRGVCQSTYGTDIDCVAGHIRSNRIRRAVLITDGFVGPPGLQDHDTLKKTRLGVGVMTPGGNADDLRSVLNECINLTEI